MSDKPSTNGPSLSSRQPASSAFAARFQVEQEHWKSVLAHIDEPATAQLIVDLFTQHPHLQASHPAVYLRAKRCVQRADKKASTAKAAGRALMLIGATCATALHLVATSALKGVLWVHTRVHKARQQPARPPVAKTELSWPVLTMPDA
jgi:hypothetical protein